MRVRDVRVFEEVGKHMTCFEQKRTFNLKLTHVMKKTLKWIFKMGRGTHLFCENVLWKIPPCDRMSFAARENALRGRMERPSKSRVFLLHLRAQLLVRVSFAEDKLDDAHDSVELQVTLQIIITKLLFITF